MTKSEKDILKVLLVDDHKMVIDGLKMILNKRNDIKIVGEAYNGTMALDFLSAHQVDLVITDINMPEMSGTELTKKIKEDYPEIKILVLTVDNDSEVVHEILMAEAEGYILKNAGKQELFAALDKILGGGTYYSNEVLQALTGQYMKKEKSEDKLKDLTKRELEVIGLICQEYTTNEIAEKLFLSRLTVETHRKNILKKTNIKTIVGLIKFAIENNLA
jgi:DNA-binding NarL/FixJ family response regulator